MFATAFPLKADPIDHAIVSVYAINSNTKEVLLDENSDISLLPSSCLKLITTAAALELIGEETRFTTELQYSGLLDTKKNSLYGNLIIRGGGDPCLASARTLSSWKLVIQDWASSVQKLGIKTIVGDVIADTSLWDPPEAIASWEWEDLGNYYAALPCALSFHDNLYFLSFLTQGQIGDIAPISSIDPPLSPSLFYNTVTIGAPGSGDRAVIFGSEIEKTRVVKGSVPQTHQSFFTIKGSIPDPASLCTTLLRKELQERGICIERKSLPDSENRNVIHTTRSPPLSQIITWTNHESVNLYAEHLIRKIGEVCRKKGSTEAGLQSVREFLQKKGISLEGFNMVDGSGLSRKNMVSTKQLTSLLLAMKESSHFPLFFASLSEKEAGIRGKDGFMSLSRGYAGYCGEIAFAILINNCPDSTCSKKKIDELCNQIVSMDGAAKSKKHGNKKPPR